MRKSQNLSLESLKKKYPSFHEVRSILIKCGLINIWDIQSNVNGIWLKQSVRQKLKDIFLNDWYSSVENSSNSTFYRIFKTFELEKYLYTTPRSLLSFLIRFRTRNHKLPIETGSWGRIPVNLRVCESCRNKVGDEYHFLFECDVFESERKKLIKKYYFNHSNTFKIEKLLNTRNKTEFTNLCKFIKIILMRIR